MMTLVRFREQSATVMRDVTLALIVCATLGASSTPSPYVVSPKATAQTKAAVAAGDPPEHGFPIIFDVLWKSTNLRPGGTVAALVTTSLNVGYVEGRYKDWNFAFDRIGPGKFHLTYKVPFLPPFLIGNWAIDVIARSVDGVEVRRSTTFRYGYW